MFGARPTSVHHLMCTITLPHLTLSNVLPCFTYLYATLYHIYLFINSFIHLYTWYTSIMYTIRILYLSTFNLVRGT